MFRIALLGVENSHANSFLGFIKDGLYPEVEVFGIYSEDAEASRALNEKFGVPVMASYDSLVGKVDGIVVTARKGSKHYTFAKPYIESGIPMFIDKPIVVDGEEAVEFMTECKKNGVRLSGGSVLKHPEKILEARADVEALEDGMLRGAMVHAPIALRSVHDGFYFYSQHLVEMVVTVFGNNVKRVFASRQENTVTAIFNYEGFDVTGLFSENANFFDAVIYTDKGCTRYEVKLTNDDFRKEFDEFFSLLKGGKGIDYNELIKPVFILNAIDESMKSNKWEAVRSSEV